MTWQLNSFNTDDELTDRLCKQLSDRLRADIIADGAASLVVSGGSTPAPLFRKLADTDLEWSKVYVTLADERWLPANDPDANARLVQLNLLQGKAAAAQFVSLTNEAETPFLAEPAIHKKLRAIALPLSAVVLGMGDDGHTASLFPAAETLSKALGGLDSNGKESLCCAVTPPAAPYQRMTLTAPTLLSCRELILHIKGKKKREILEQAMQPGPVEALPIRAFLHQDLVALNIYYSEQ